MMLQSARELGSPWDEATCIAAAEGGHLHVLAWAKKEGCPWDGAEVRCVAFEHENDNVWQWAWDEDGVCPLLWGSGSLLAMLEWVVYAASRMLTLFAFATLAGPLCAASDLLESCGLCICSVVENIFRLSVTQESTTFTLIFVLILWPVLALSYIMALYQLLAALVCWRTAHGFLLTCHCFSLGITLGAVQCACGCMVAWSLFKAVYVVGKAAVCTVWVVAMAPLQVTMGVMQIWSRGAE